jgi:hypothetical protein
MEQIQELRRKISAVEIALGNTGSTELLSPAVKDASIEQAHRAIIDCFKVIAEAFEALQRPQSQ